MRTHPLFLAVPLLLAPLACGTEDANDSGEDKFSSNQATLLSFEFDGEFLTGSVFGGDAELIEDQLLFTIGHLNGDHAVGRLDAVKLTNVTRTKEGTKTLIKYHAELPVSWGSKTNLPTTYSFRLPRDLGFEARDAFTEKYKHDCVDFGAHDVDSSSMWYYYRPNNEGCAIPDAEVYKSEATVTVSTLNTTGKYPEYDKVWEDDALNVVAVFGKYEKGKTSDVGITGYNNFISAVSTELKRYKVATVPALLPAVPGVGAPDIEIRADLGNGRKIRVNALLVDEVSSASPEFFARYEGLSTDADLITYNGHAGLGQNVRALSRHGKFKTGKYVIVFMNGCDTFAYVDGSLAETRKILNPDDPTGTKYMEFVTNTMPAFFSSMPTASMALIRGLASVDKPLTYEQIFDNVDDDQIIVVTGEEDNAFQPK